MQQPARDQSLSEDDHAALTVDSEASPSLRAAVIQGLRWSSIASFSTELVLFGSMVVLARLISPAQFGPYAVAVIAQQLVIAIPAQGVGNALVQREKVTREHLQAGQALSLLFGLALAGLTLVVAGTIAGPIFGSNTASLVRLSAPMSTVAAAGIVPAALLRRQLAFRRLSLINVASTLVYVATAIAFAAAGLGGASLVLGAIAGALVGSLAAWAWAPPPVPRLRRREARDILSFGGPASMAAVSWVCFANCDYAIVGARLGTLQAGFYLRAYTLGVTYQKKLSDVMSEVAFPVLSRATGASTMSAMRGRIVRLLTTVLFPMLVLLALVAPELVPWMLGPRWAPVVVPTQILVVGGVSTLVADMAGVAMMASGRVRSLLVFGLAHFAVYATAVLFLAPYGLAAVAGAAAVVHTAFLLVAYVFMLRGTGERPLRALWADVAPATVSCLGLLAVATPTSLMLSSGHVPVPVYLAAVTLVGAGGYLAVLRLAFSGAWRELVLLFTSVLPLERLRVWRRPPASVPSIT
jgi:PST family polysaccharide transporter